MDQTEQIARAVLYEGYILWPYTRSSLKNQKRWTFGGVYPERWSTADHEDDPCRMRSQCLIEADGETTIDVTLRFLHIVERQAARARGEALEFVDEIEVSGERHLSWDESTEREIAAPGLELAALESGHRVPVRMPAGSDTEWLSDGEGVYPGALVRSWDALDGALEVRAEPAGDGLFRVTIEAENTSPCDAADGRDAAQKQAFASMHAVLHSEDGAFVSLRDPPEACESAVEQCENDGWWPVLVGERGSRDTMISSPIILYDYPEVAPESPGDLFDGTEIDELLIRSVLSMTDEEKEEMRATDPRAREILDRCAELSPEELMQLHGTIRNRRSLRRR